MTELFTPRGGSSLAEIQALADNLADPTYQPTEEELALIKATIDHEFPEENA